jgi:3-hydroxymyristoyl/3-hydroxydecanoyl-(acyl carrier protein) dehydratase
MEEVMLKPKVIVEGKDIEEYMPHRFENVLLDKVESFEENEEKLLAKIELTISENDPEGRQVFLVKNQEGKLVYNAHMFPENLALGALTYLNTIVGKGHAALFSTIANFQKSGDILAGEKMSASIYLKREKGPFKTFCGKVFNESGEQVAETDVMAYIYMLADATPENDGEKKKVEVPELTIDEAVDFSKIDNKQRDMFFVEKLVNFDEENMSAVTEFTYPADHPFVKGHFPGNPIMMGVCQWMSTGDALDVAALKLKELGKVVNSFNLKADVELLKPDGVLVAEVKGIEKNYIVDGENIKPRTVATKKCGFRDMVVPGEKIFQRLSNIEISSQ